MNGKDTALFSKASDEWSTPQWLFDLLDKEFHFDVDAACTSENSKCPFGFLPQTDCDNRHSLIIDWYEHGGIFWLNPPYSKIGAFMKKAYEESLKGAVVVCLIPSRTDTKYWHDYVMKAQEIRFVKGRLKFEAPCYNLGEDTGIKRSSCAPFPSVIVIFDQSYYKMYQMPTLPHPIIGKTIEQSVKP
jgi:site-specific DNA-methyltransferase (adenine-specific)